MHDCAESKRLRAALQTDGLTLLKPPLFGSVSLFVSITCLCPCNMCASHSAGALLRLLIAGFPDAAGFLLVWFPVGDLSVGAFGSFVNMLRDVVMATLTSEI